jgi:hypothetical protein
MLLLLKLALFFQISVQRTAFSLFTLFTHFNFIRYLWILICHFDFCILIFDFLILVPVSYTTFSILLYILQTSIIIVNRNFGIFEKYFISTPLNQGYDCRLILLEMDERNVASVKKN